MLQAPEQKHSGRWFVIVNPNAGGGKAGRLWPDIAKEFEEEGLRIEVRMTAGPGDAAELAREAAGEGHARFVVVGGDGTMNEVVNGLMHQQQIPTARLQLGIVPVGTGNDWRRMFAIPADIKGAVATLKKGKTLLQDVGIIRYHHGKEERSRYFLNIAGLGFDAVVVQRANLLKQAGRSGLGVYLRTLFTTLASYRHTHTRLDLDGRTFADDVFTISIGIGRYSGGGMRQTPHALPDDGYFDVTIIRKIGKLDILRHLGMLFNGRLPEHPRVTTCRAKKIRVDSTPPIHVQADGETLGHSPLEIQILEKRMNVIVGEKYAQ